MNPKENVERVTVAVMATTAPKVPEEWDGVTFMCCFCGEDITRGEATTLMADPFGVTQGWWCHIDCLKNAMHKDAWVDPTDEIREERE